MKKKFFAFLKYFVAFGIAGFLIWWSLHDLTAKDRSDIKEALLRARFLLIIPVFIILLLSHWLRSLRWRQMIECIGYKPPVFDLLCALLIGYLANQLVPRAGEIIRCTVVAKQNKIPAEKLIGTIVAERTVDVICLFILSVATFFIEYEYISSYASDIANSLSKGFRNNHQLLLIVSVVLIAVLLLLIWFYKKTPGHKAALFFSKVLQGLKQGLFSVQKVRNKPLYIIYTVAIWLCYALSTYIGCRALQETSHLNFLTSIALLVFGTFGVIVAPGGLGAYPIAIQKTLVLYGLNANIGLAAGWILWIAQFIFTIFFGSLAYIIVQVRNKKQA